MSTEDARSIYDRAIVIDGLNVSNWNSPGVFESLRNGRVTAMNATIATWENYQETLLEIQAWLGRYETYEDLLMPIHSTSDILWAKETGRVGIILGFQNATPIENDLGHLAVFHALGVRIIQLSFHERSLLADGCYESANAGLSNFGRDAVREMNRLGILIDLSHVGERSTMEAIEHSEKPVAVTHANCKGYFDRPRNKTDEAVRLLAERGGVVGATAICSFLKTQFESTLDDYLDAIDDMVQRIGPDHVGFGIDFTQDQPESFWRYIGSQQGTSYPAVFQDPNVKWEEYKLYPDDLTSPDELPNLASGLQRRGYSGEEITGILGGNWLRLFGEVWEEA